MALYNSKLNDLQHHSVKIQGKSVGIHGSSFAVSILKTVIVSSNRKEKEGTRGTSFPLCTSPFILTFSLKISFSANFTSVCYVFEVSMLNWPRHIRARLLGKCLVKAMVAYPVEPMGMQGSCAIKCRYTQMHNIFIRQDIVW